jgi:hypothetical protein
MEIVKEIVNSVLLLDTHVLFSNEGSKGDSKEAM